MKSKGERIYRGRVMFGKPVLARKIINIYGDEMYVVIETGQHVYPQAFKQVEELEAEGGE